MGYELSQRVLAEANFVVKNNATIRMASKVFGVSKSTMHIDLTRRLKEIDKMLYAKVKQVLEYNLSVRHLRGGESTRRNYLCKKAK